MFSAFTESLVNRPSGVRRQVNRSRVFHWCVKKNIFSLPSLWLNGQLGPLQTFLAEEWLRAVTESENTSAMLEVSHLPLLQLCYLLLSPVEISKELNLRVTHMKDTSKPSWFSFLFLLEEREPDMTSVSSSSTSLKLLAPSWIHKEEEDKKEVVFT